MRIRTLLGGFLLVGLFGCASFPAGFDEISSQTNIVSDRIVLIATSIQPGGLETQYHWVIEKDGKSLGTLFHRESSFDGCRTVAYELPSGIHEECLAKLTEIRFFQMRTSEELNFSGFEKRPPISRIEVHHRGKKHVVDERINADVDDGYNKLWLFVGAVQQRSTTLSSKTGPPSAFYNRTADKLGGVISGLTSAGPTP